MTPIAGFVIAVIAGWIVGDPRRAAVTVIVPFLAVLTAQSWLLAAGRGVSPPSTVTGFPQLIGYWGLQVIFLALAVGIAAELGALRRRRSLRHEAGAGAGRRAATASGVLAVLTAVFVAAYLLDSSPVRHHAASGSPPAQGVIGIVLCIVAFAALSVVIFGGRRATARAGRADADTSAVAADVAK